VTGKLHKCDEATIQGRLRKAEQFMEGAHTIREFADDEGDIGDAYVTLCVHAGIAAALDGRTGDARARILTELLGTIPQPVVP